MYLKIKDWFHGGHFKIGHIINYSTNQALFSLKGCLWTKWHRSWGFSFIIKHVLLKYLQENVKFWTFSWSFLAAILDWVLNITFHHLKILERTIKCKLRLSNRASTMFNNTFREKHGFYGGHIYIWVAVIYGFTRCVSRRFSVKYGIIISWYVRVDTVNEWVQYDLYSVQYGPYSFMYSVIRPDKEK